MERLTIRTPKGAALKMDDTYQSEDEAKKALMQKYRFAIDRLAAYEDTGLEPEELEYIARAKRGERMVTDEELRQAGVSQAEIEALEKIATAIAEGRPIALMPRWIPVTERLPESFQTVIVCRKRKGNGTVIEQGSMNVNGWWNVYGTRTKSVTHWMPLPEPPKEEKK